jgi:ubiquinone/menaquinone biosynthesis C-methylase UbiE
VDGYRAASLESWSSVAPDWARLTAHVDRQLRVGTDWMIDALALEPGERVLELAGGPGTFSAMAARSVDTAGQVIYSDFAEPMVRAARERLNPETFPNVECQVIDAEAIDLADESIDASPAEWGTC